LVGSARKPVGARVKHAATGVVAVSTCGSGIWSLVKDAWLTIWVYKAGLSTQTANWTARDSPASST